MWLLGISSCAVAFPLDWLFTIRGAISHIGRALLGESLLDLHNILGGLVAGAVIGRLWPRRPTVLLPGALFIVLTWAFIGSGQMKPVLPESIFLFWMSAVYSLAGLGLGYWIVARRYAAARREIAGQRK